MKRTKRIPFRPTEFMEWFVQLPGAARDEVENRTATGTVLIEFWHACNGNESPRKCVSEQIASISDIAVLDRVIDVGND